MSFFFIFYFFYFSFIFISWRLITLQYCSGFCHRLHVILYIPSIGICQITALEVALSHWFPPGSTNVMEVSFLTFYHRPSQGSFSIMWFRPFHVYIFTVISICNNSKLGMDYKEANAFQRLKWNRSAALFEHCPSTTISSSSCFLFCHQGLFYFC